MERRTLQVTGQRMRFLGVPGSSEFLGRPPPRNSEEPEELFMVFSRAPRRPATRALPMNVKKRLLDGARMNRAIRRMAIEVVEKNRGLDDLMIVGIRSRGVPIGERMAREIEQMEGQPVAFGILDITLYRDDLTTIAPQPVVKPTKLPEPIDDKIIVLVDDVLYTGRTVRAALDALIDFGRPKQVMLAVLIDRGHRELPIHADVVGKTVPTDANEVIKVKLAETDGDDEVLIMEK